MLEPEIRNLRRFLQEVPEKHGAYVKKYILQPSHDLDESSFCRNHDVTTDESVENEKAFGGMRKGFLLSDSPEAVSESLKGTSNSPENKTKCEEVVPHTGIDRELKEIVKITNLSGGFMYIHGKAANYFELISHGETNFQLYCQLNRSVIMVPLAAVYIQHNITTTYLREIESSINYFALDKAIPKDNRRCDVPYFGVMFMGPKKIKAVMKTIVKVVNKKRYDLASIQVLDQIDVIKVLSYILEYDVIALQDCFRCDSYKKHIQHMNDVFECRSPEWILRVLNGLDHTTLDSHSKMFLRSKDIEKLYIIDSFLKAKVELIITNPILCRFSDLLGRLVEDGHEQCCPVSIGSETNSSEAPADEGPRELKPETGQSSTHFGGLVKGFLNVFM